MNASFYAIYKRGRFGSRDDPEEEKQQQRERFGVACLAFCLRYDSTFLGEFLRRICKCEHQANDWSIQVEPYHEGWSDLLITTGNVAVLIECKVDNDLMNKQNPWASDSAFEKEPKGYGYQFRDNHKAGKLYYTLLTHSIDEQPKRVLDIKCCTATWRDVSQLVISKEKMISDLFTTLGNLHYPSFRIMKANKLHVSDLHSILAAHEILGAVATEGNFSHSPIRAESRSGEEENCDNIFGWLGAYIPGNKRNEWLCSVIKPPPHNPVAWYGYELDESEVTGKPSFPKLGIYLHCGTSSVRENVEKRVKALHKWKKDPTWSENAPLKKHYLRYSCPLEPQESPADLFVQFFKTIAPSSKPKKSKK